MSNYQFTVPMYVSSAVPLPNLGGLAKVSRGCAKCRKANCIQQ